MDAFEESQSMLTGLGVDLSFWSMMASFVFGIIGFYLFREGRKRTFYPWIFIGITLMSYPLFVSGAWLNWGVGSALTAFAYFSRKS